MALTLGVIGLGGFLFVDWLRDSAQGYEPDCDSYDFNRAEWGASGDTGVGDDSREHQAEALAECEALDGLSRADVSEMLGPHSKKVPGTGPRKWHFSAGWVNDGFGPGDGQSLYVYFDERGRVERAKLGYPQ